jgi:hypothetical protein
MRERPPVPERFRAGGVILRRESNIRGETAMKSVLLATGAALLIGLATATSGAIAQKAGLGGGGGGGGGGGAAISHGGGGGGGPMQGGGGGGGGVAMSRGGPSGPSGGSFAPAIRGGNFNGGNAGTFNGGNAMSFRGDSRMGRMEHDHDHDRDHDHDHDRRFRSPGFAFGYYPGYDYYNYNTYDDESCYQWQHVPTRRGWRWLRIWVCD